MKAIILADSKGKGLYPLTASMPKALLPVGNEPVIETNIRKLKAEGFDEFEIVIGSFGNKIRAYLGSGENLGVNITYVPQYSKSDIFTINGEWLFGNDFTEENANKLESIEEYVKANKFETPIFDATSQIDEDAKISGNTIIGKNTVIGEGCIIKNSIIMDNVCIESDCEIENAIICSNAIVKSGTFVFDYGIIGEGATVGYNVFVKAKGIVPPYKTVADETFVDPSATPYPLSVCINENEIRGNLLKEITPSFCLKTGRCIAGLCENSESVGLCRDNNKKSLPLYHALLSGLISVGIKVYEFESNIYPAYFTHLSKIPAYFNIYISTTDNEGTIEILGKNGNSCDFRVLKKLEERLNRNIDEYCISNSVEIEKVSPNYLNEIKNFALPFKGGVKINCTNPYVKECLCFYNQCPPYSAEFTLNDKMDKVSFENLSERKMQILFSLILSEDYKEKIIPSADVSAVVRKISGMAVAKRKNISENFMSSRLLKDGIFGMVLILNYMHRRKLNKEQLIEKIPEIYSVSRNILVRNDKREEVIQKLTDGKYSGKVKILEDGGWIMLIPHGKENNFTLVAEGYNKDYAEDLLEFYIRKISETLEEV